MATRTIELGSFSGGLVVFEADYNDTNNRVLSVRCINNSSQNARGTAITQQGESFSRIFSPGTSSVNIPPGKIDVKVRDGEIIFDGTTQFEFPVA